MGSSLRIATFNIHGGRPASGPVDLAATAAAIRTLNADLVALQEVHRLMPPPGVFQDQPRRLRRFLGGCVSFRRSFGVGRYGYGNAVWSPAPPRRVRRFPLPGRGEPRSVLECDFPLPGGALRLLVTHLGLGAGEPRRQAEALLRRVEASPLPVVLAGDLNATPDGPELALLLEAGLRHGVDPSLLSFPAHDPRERLDYLLVGPGLQASGGVVAPAAASDHLPLVTMVALEPQFGQR